MYILRSLQVALIFGMALIALRFVFIAMCSHFTDIAIYHSYWIYYSYQLLFLAVAATMEFVFVSQICEWIALLFILLSQKNLSINEMFHDYNMFNSQLRKKERVMKAIFLVFLVSKLVFALFLACVQISCTNMITLPLVYGTLNLYMNSFNLALKAVVFAALMCAMRKYGHRVYKKTSKRLFIFFIVDMISYSTAIVVYTNERLNADLFTAQTFWWYFFTFAYTLNLPHILTGISYLYLKSHSDLIMELSKLDYLLIVSIFQREKEPADERMSVSGRLDRLSSFRELLK